MKQVLGASAKPGWAMQNPLLQPCIAGHSAIVPIVWVLGFIVLHSSHSLLCSVLHNLWSSMHVCIDGLTSPQMWITHMYIVLGIVINIICPIYRMISIGIVFTNLSNVCTTTETTNTVYRSHHLMVPLSAVISWISHPSRSHFRLHL